MIATNDGIYVDETDPFYDAIADFSRWMKVSRNLNRVFASGYIIVTSTENYPDYLAIKKALCESLTI